MSVIAAPSQSLAVSQAFNFTMGVFDNTLEQSYYPRPDRIGEHRDDQHLRTSSSPGDSVRRLSAQDLATLSSLSISANAKAYITAAIDQGLLVIVPSQEVPIAGKSTVSWLEINPTTGEIAGVLENGIRSVVEYTSGEVVVEDSEGYVIAAEATELGEALTEVPAIESEVTALEEAEAVAIKAAKANRAFGTAAGGIVAGYATTIAGVIHNDLATIGFGGALTATFLLASAGFGWGLSARRSSRRAELLRSPVPYPDGPSNLQSLPISTISETRERVALR